LVVPTVSNFFEGVVVSITAALITLLSFIPALIGALLILIIGWIIAGIVGRLVTTVLQKVGFETAAERTGVTGFLSRSGARGWTASKVIGELAKWFIRLIFLEAAAQAVHLTAISELINRVVFFIPNLVVALVVLLIGALIGKVLAGIVRGAASEAGFDSPNLLASVAQYAVIGFAAIIAVNQIGVAAAIVNTLFTAIVAAIALAVALAFGLGGREVAGEIWRRWYLKSQGAASRLEQAAQSASASGNPAPPQSPAAAQRVRPVES